MCGVCGFVDSRLGAGEAASVLRRMTATLRHRGPDDEGFFDDGTARLGHRRLSIIDLSLAGRQPMPNEDGRIQVALNGEIYNFAELRPGIEARGHSFRSRTDTEVLAHLYEEKGEGMLRALNGMFGLAVWDCRERTLLLARDRFGKKPLYYSLPQRGGIVFGSEIKALLAHPDVERVLDPVALRRYLLFDAVPAPASIFKGIRKLMPGSFLIYREGTVSEASYHEISFGGAAFERLSDDDFVEAFLERLRRAIGLRLVSDVPLGVFLSGGVDSTLVAACMADLLPPDRIKTFSIGFEDRSFDESSHARTVARHLGTDHREKTLRPEAMLDALPAIADMLDEPLADASIVPTYLLSAFTREHVTVALGGDGGDEMLLGYPTFIAHALASLYERVPRVLDRGVVRRLASLLPVSTSNISLDYKVKRFLVGMDYPAPARHFVWIGAVDPLAQESLIAPDVLSAAPTSSVLDPVSAHASACAPRDDYDLLSYLYARLYLGDDVLAKVDRATMAHALEARAPLLDPAVVEIAAAMPTRMKMRGLTLKYVMRRALRGKVPAHIARRPKKGFGVPVAEWLKGPLLPLARELLSAERVRAAGLFRPEAVAGLLDDHLAARTDNRKPLWSLLCFEMWRERYGGGR